MSRVARIVLPGIPHHVTQRGNNHQDVFFVDDENQARPGFGGARAGAVRWAATAS